MGHGVDQDRVRRRRALRGTGFIARWAASFSSYSALSPVCLRFAMKVRVRPFASPPDANSSFGASTMKLVANRYTDMISAATVSS